EDFKELLVKEFCPSNAMEKMELEFWNHAMVGDNHAVYTDRFHELAKLVPNLLTPKSKRMDRYIYGLVPQICEMIRVTQPTIIQRAILKDRALIDEAVRCGTLSKNVEKRKETEGLRKQEGSWSDNKRAKVGKGFMATGTTSNEYIAGRQVASINAVKMGNIQRECYEYGSPNHLRNTCLKLNRAPGQVGNCLTIEGNQNPRNNGNQARGRAFNVNTIKARQDPNVMIGIKAMLIFVNPSS
ncbi:hypothetical protein Tco_1081080, partial [Tanacetum coccineum]